MTERTMLRIHLFGTLILDDGQRKVDRWPRQSNKLLLAYFALYRGRPLERDRLCELFFPNLNPDKAIRSLRSRISELRKLLDPDDIQGRDGFITVPHRGAYVFNANAPCWMDIEAFDLRLIKAKTLLSQQRWDDARRQLREALSLYRDRLLIDEPYEEWLMPLRRQYQHQVEEALLQMADCMTHLGRPERALDWLQRAIELNPLFESGYLHLIDVYQSLGQMHQAVAVSKQMQRVFEEQQTGFASGSVKQLRQELEANRDAKTYPTFHNLPPESTPFVGRTQDIKVLLSKLEDSACRWITLVGAGGMGKSRLAAKVAEEVLDHYRDGVFWVGLISARAETVAETIVESLPGATGSGDPIARLMAFFKQRKALLVCDNFEHLSTASTLFQQLLAESETLNIVVTSRHALQQPEEWQYQLQGLIHSEEQGEAQELFYQQADLDQDDSQREEVESINRICELVDGNALAIKLAASQVAQRPCNEIADAIEISLDALDSKSKNAQDQHASMRILLTQSYQALNPDEQKLLSALSVFRGSFSYRAVKAVTGVAPSTVGALIDHSMLARSEPGRFEIHNLIRQFGLEQLARSAEEAKRCHLAHAEYFLGLPAGFNQAILSGTYEQLRQCLIINWTNISAAWQTASTYQRFDWIEQAIKGVFVTALDRDLFQETIALFSQTATSLISSQPSQPGLLWAKLTSRQSRLHTALGQFDEAQRLQEKSLQVVQQIGDVEEEANTLLTIGIRLSVTTVYDKAKIQLHQSLAMFESLDLKYDQAATLSMLGIVARTQGDYAQAQAYLESALGIWSQLQIVSQQARALGNLGVVYWVQGKYESAKANFESCIEAFGDLDQPQDLAIGYSNLGGVVLELGDIKRARGLFFEALNIHRRYVNKLDIAKTLIDLGQFPNYDSNFSITEARAYLEEGLEIVQCFNTPLLESYARLGLGRLAFGKREFTEAKDQLREGVRLAQVSQSNSHLLNVLLDFGKVLVEEGSTKEATTLLTGIQAHPGFEARHQPNLDALLESLPVATSKIQSPTVDEMVALVMTLKPPQS